MSWSPNCVCGGTCGAQRARGRAPPGHGADRAGGARSKIGIWANDMPDGVYEDGRGHGVNMWEQLGYDRLDVVRRESRIGSTAYTPKTGSVSNATSKPTWPARRRVMKPSTGSGIKTGRTAGSCPHSVAVRDAAGTPIRFNGSTVDITDRRRAEEALRERGAIPGLLQSDHRGSRTGRSRPPVHPGECEVL